VPTALDDIRDRDTVASGESLSLFPRVSLRRCTKASSFAVLLAVALRTVTRRVNAHAKFTSRVEAARYILLVHCSFGLAVRARILCHEKFLVYYASVLSTDLEF